mmetsp:Transcript_25685/g.60400  ORF Transcript_25685/g.60400 Transcript_25685/m.60400 type:complete len:111 (-) Transcript_25685:345-677(-)
MFMKDSMHLIYESIWSVLDFLYVPMRNQPFLPISRCHHGRRQVCRLAWYSRMYFTCTPSFIAPFIRPKPLRTSPGAAQVNMVRGKRCTCLGGSSGGAVAGSSFSEWSSRT